MINKLFSIDKQKYKTIIYLLGIRIQIKSVKQKISKIEDDYIKYQNLLNAIIPPSKLPPATGELRQGQLLSINLLKDLKQICDSNNITYWIDFGSLLGAVRHKGYIPWDSDIDTCMLKEDFNKIIPLLKNKYKNSDIEVRENGYINHFQIRIQQKNDDTYGVDIFPVEKYYESEINDDNFDYINKKIKFATKKLKKLCIRSIKLQVTPELYKKKIKEINDKYIMQKKKPSLHNPILYFAIDYPIPYKNLLRNYDDVFPLTEIEFEGEKFACPNKIENCLRYLYSDNYMQYPPRFKHGEDKIKEYIDNLKGNDNG